jgi:TRAP-type mannitol/chloroaromatic compound transport system permease large subunit
MQTTFLAQQFVPLMFCGLFAFLLTGFPVAFALAATGLAFGFIGMEAGIFPASLFQALPLRIFGIMQNDTLLAIPFFTFMGIILERSGMAEDLLETVGQVFGPLRGGLAIAVILVGALLAATTRVVAASSAPTRITAMARPPRSGPKTWPTVSSKSSAMPERSRMMPMKVKNGIASSVSFCMMPKMRSGKA